MEKREDTRINSIEIRNFILVGLMIVFYVFNRIIWQLYKNGFEDLVLAHHYIYRYFYCQFYYIAGSIKCSIESIHKGSVSLIKSVLIIVGVLLYEQIQANIWSLITHGEDFKATEEVAKNIKLNIPFSMRVALLYLFLKK